jgi:CRISPR-associated protein Cas2
MTRSKAGQPIETPAPSSEPLALSGYRIMWLFVLFDLPVGTKRERKAATDFRHDLLDLGFEMSQFSVYIKYCAGKEQVNSLSKHIEGAMPTSGKVHMVQITDKQYENVRTYRGRKREPSRKNPDQFNLF